VREDVSVLSKYLIQALLEGGDIFCKKASVAEPRLLRVLRSRLPLEHLPNLFIVFVGEVKKVAGVEVYVDILPPVT